MSLYVFIYGPFYIEIFNFHERRYFVPSKPVTRVVKKL